MASDSSPAQSTAANTGAANPSPVTPADRLAFTLFLAIAFHAIIVLGIGFSPSEPSDRSSNTIEVTIAHKTSEEAPEEADFIAQANQAGSGNEEEKKELTTDEQALFDSENLNQVQLQAPSTKQTTPEFSQTLVITTQGLSPKKVSSKKKPDKTPPKPLPEKETESLNALSQEIATLQARLDEQKQAYAKRPKIRTLSSVSARAHYEAIYLDSFRREVEAMATRNFPSKALKEEKFGDVRLMVALNQDGSVRDMEVLGSSGHRFLDEAAMQSVRLAGPFAPFTKEMKDNIDILEIIRTWRFDKKQQVTSH